MEQSISEIQLSAKTLDIKINPTYTCQNCGIPFETALERKIEIGKQPICPECSIKSKYKKVGKKNEK